MVDKIEMSLDEIIKTTKKPARSGPGGRGSGGFKRNNGPRGGPAGRGGPPARQSGTGGILKGRNRGGSIQKPKFNRSRVIFHTFKI